MTYKGHVSSEEQIALLHDRDEELEWIDEQISRLEEGQMGEAESNPSMLQARRDYLERLRRVRSRLLGEVSP